MNITALFIRRPVATILLTIGIMLFGILGFFHMPVAELPNMSFPIIQVMAQMPGANPEVMSSTVAAPLERYLGTISGLKQMFSQSGSGFSAIILEFDFSRNIDGAKRDVEAAIQASRAALPTNLRSNPTYRAFNPAGQPIFLLALTSKTYTPAEIYQATNLIIAQKLSQISGVGDIDLSGAAMPAVRVELEPGKLASYGIGVEDVRAALAGANANAPKGYFNVGPVRYQIATNDQATKAQQFGNLVIAYRNGQAVRLDDVAKVENSVENVDNAGLYNGMPAVLVIIRPSPGANVIKTVDAIKAALPSLQAALPPTIKTHVLIDNSVSVRASVGDTERTMFIAMILVVGVVFLFLRSPRATLIPGLAVPVSIIGALGPMYLLGFSVDNFSLMALTVASGFVVDDAVVMTENIMRHIENGMPPKQAALLGGQEVAFTVLSMSCSLIAVFLPILLLPGFLGILLREFAGTIIITILISLLVSITTTPMLCALFLKSHAQEERTEHPFRKMLEQFFDDVKHGYEKSLRWALEHSKFIGILFFVAIVLNFVLLAVVPKALFPVQNTDLLIGTMQADQSTSFAAMKARLIRAETIIKANPNVETVSGFTGGRSTNSAFFFVRLKSANKRKLTAQQIVAQLRKPLAHIVGAQTYLSTGGGASAGSNGRQSNATYQYTFTSDNYADLKTWVPRIIKVLKKDKDIVDVNSDMQDGGLETNITINRADAARYGLTPEEVDQTLYDAFGQRVVSTIYEEQNQYAVVMEFAPRYQQTPADLARIYVTPTGGWASGTELTQLAAGSILSGTVSASSQTATIAQDSATNQAINSITGGRNSSAGTAVSTNQETMVPLAAFASIKPGLMPVTINHQDRETSATLSFSLPPGVALGTADAQISNIIAELDVPTTIKGGFAGEAQELQTSKSREPYVFLAALATVYIVLGILYESTIHPLTILSTVPSAGVGATLLLLMLDVPMSVVALIGLILLIGIVMKNAILMVDFALALQRRENVAPEEAIFKAAILRFRPILMTTFAAALGAVPLAVGVGEGGALREPLGLTIIGGLLASQALTLYTTPVLYLWLERLAIKLRGGRDHTLPRAGSIVEDQP